MEYTDIEKYFNHIRGQLAWIPLEDEHIKAQVEGTLKSVDELESALAVRVPSSPVLSFEEFVQKFPIKHNGSLNSLKAAYEGYLIGTRGIVPEISEEVKNNFESLLGYVEAWRDGKKYDSHIDAVIDELNAWLRSQINK